MKIVKQACQATVDVFSKYLKEQIMDIIDGDKKVKHSKLAEGTGINIYHYSTTFVGCRNSKIYVLTSSKYRVSPKECW